MALIKQTARRLDGSLMSKSESRKRPSSDEDLDRSSLPSKHARNSSLDNAISLHSAVLKIKVGEDTDKAAEEFMIHKNVLEAESVLFQKMFASDWKDSQLEVQFPTMEPKTFKIYSHWLYTHTILYTKATDDSSFDEAGVRIFPELQRLGKSLELGHFINDMDFTDAVVHTWLGAIKTLRIADVDLSFSLFKNSDPESPYRDLALDYAVFERDEEQVEALLDGLGNDAEFCLAITLAFARKTKTTSFPYKRSPCQYHEHARFDKPCYRERFDLN